MLKRGVLLIFLIFSLMIVSAQSQVSVPTLGFTNIGSNFDKTCSENVCTTKIYSYEKYFERNGIWEEIDENWNECLEGYCTNDYYFRATANSQGEVTAYLNNEELSMQLSDMLNYSLNFNPSIQDSVITYEDVIPNVDLTYQYLPKKLKEEIIIKDPLENLPLEDFEITFTKSGSADFLIERPYICEASGHCEYISYELNSDSINLQIPIEFMTNENYSYPLIVDPTITLNESSINWNGVIEEDLSEDPITYSRFDNPTRLDLGYSPAGNTVGAIDWDITGVPIDGTLLNVTLRLFIETFTAPNFINITNMEQNSSLYPKTESGNQLFYEDILNGTIYSHAYSAFPGNNFYYDFVFNQAGLNKFNQSLDTGVFSVGIDTQKTANITISARDHHTAGQRPFFLIESSYSQYNLTYDANGNLINGFGKLLTYDSWNRLRQVNDSTTKRIIADYLYDHNGKRIRKIAYDIDAQKNNLTTYYIGEPPAEFVHNRITNGTIFNETYIYLYDKLIARYDNNGRKFFYHPDHLGSTTLVTNESGDVVENIAYLPFGSVLSGDESERYLYTGQEFDSETGFYDYGARQYDSEFKRFLQPDPLISDVYNPQNLNRYSYVLNNPYKYKDPTGKFVDPVSDAIIISAGLGALIGIVTAVSGSDPSLVNIIDSAVIGLESGAAFPVGVAAGIVSRIPGGPAIGGSYASALAGELTSNYLEGNGFGITDPEDLGEKTTTNYFENKFGILFGEVNPFENNNEGSSGDFISDQIKPKDDEYTSYQNQPNYRQSQSQDDGGRRGGIFQTPSGSNPGPSGGSGSSSGGSGGGSGGSGGNGGSSGSHWYCLGRLLC